MTCIFQYGLQVFDVCYHSLRLLALWTAKSKRLAQHSDTPHLIPTVGSAALKEIEMLKIVAKPVRCFDQQLRNDCALFGREIVIVQKNEIVIYISASDVPIHGPSSFDMTRETSRTAREETSHLFFGSSVAPGSLPVTFTQCWPARRLNTKPSEPNSLPGGLETTEHRRKQTHSYAPRNFDLNQGQIEKHALDAYYGMATDSDRTA
jgi:hypothetical protein